MTVLLTIVISILAPLIAFLISSVKYKDRETPKIYYESSFFVGLVCIVIFIVSYDKFFSEPKSWVLKGEIVRGEVIEDGEKGEFSTMRSFFDPQEDVNKNYLGLIDLAVLLCIVGGPSISYFLFVNRLARKDTIIENENGFLISNIVVASTLIISLLPMPHWYYNVARFLVMLTFGHLASTESKQNNFPLWAVFVTIAIMFCPFWTISFTRLVWNIIDIISAVILISYSVKKYIDSKY